MEDNNGDPVNVPAPGNAYNFTSGNPNERSYAVAAHLAAAAGLIGVPLGNIVGPLVIFMVYGKISAFVEENAKESLNFQISLTIYMIVSMILSVVIIGIITGIVVLIFGIVQVIKAGAAAREGYFHRYPCNIRFIK